MTATAPTLDSMASDDSTAAGPAADDPTEVVAEAVNDTAGAETSAAATAYSSDPHIGEDTDYIQHVSRRKVAGIAAGIIAAAAGAVCGVFWLAPAAHHQTSQPHAAPTPMAPTPGPLNGTFRVDRYRGQSVIHEPSGGLTSPGKATTSVETEWWAYLSSCVQGVCTATGTELDNDTHQHSAVNKSHLASDEFSQTLRLVNGQWVSARPNSAQQPCAHSVDHSDTWEWSLTLTPLPDGTLKGEETDRVVTNECAAMGTVVDTPVVAARVGDVPPKMGS